MVALHPAKLVSAGDVGLAVGGEHWGSALIQRMGDLWVDAVNGDDGADGLTAGTAFRTIQRAADLAVPGTIVHIMPGVYRETVWPATDGSASEPILYLAEDGPGTAIIRGSESSQSLVWTQLAEDFVGLPPGVDPTNLYYADLSAWELDGPPHFVVELDDAGNAVARLPLAREPDWQVASEWRHHEFWWAADGGSAEAGCDPTAERDCDLLSRSLTQLSDRSDDTEPAGIEPGNLTTLGDLTGATLVAIDTNQGHYVYRRTVIDHRQSVGRITVDESCEIGEGSGDPGLGWGTKYYVEGRPNLLDSPGEWWYDEDTGYLYLWPRTPGDPATLNIEIARRNHGFQLTDRSYIILDGLVIEILNGNAVDQSNGADSKSYENVIRNAKLRYASRGVHLSQSTDGPAQNATIDFVLEDSEIAYIDARGINLFYGWSGGSEPESFTHVGIVDTVIRGNELHHLGFRTDGDSASGLWFTRASGLFFENNYVHHVAHNGIEFHKSVVQSSKEWGFSPAEIKTGEILVKDNLFEKACQLTADCGALKFWGNPPDEHVYRDVLVTGNVFRDTMGWSYVSEKRGLRSGGTSSDVQGMSGRGLYVDHASGIHVYRNIAYNNAFAGFVSYADWRDGDMVYYNNIAANSFYGFRLAGLDDDTHPSVNTQVVNNIMVNNEGYGIFHSQAAGPYDSTVLDHNLYYNNGWRAQREGGSYKPGAMVVSRSSNRDKHYRTVAVIQGKTAWESHGVEGDPGFWDYDPDDHGLYDGSWSDFHVTAASGNAVDRGTSDLPRSLVRLLEVFDVDDVRFGIAFDIGRYEAAGASATPTTRFLLPGTAAQISLRLFPVDFPEPLTLSLVTPPPDLSMDISSSVLGPDEAVAFIVTDQHEPGTEIIPPLLYTVTVASTHAEVTQYTDVRVAVGGPRIYLPLIIKERL